MIKAPDSSEDLVVEDDEGDDRQSTSEHKTGPVDVVSAQRGFAHNISKKGFAHKVSVHRKCFFEIVAVDFWRAQCSHILRNISEFQSLLQSMLYISELDHMSFFYHTVVNIWAT